MVPLFFKEIQPEVGKADIEKFEERVKEKNLDEVKRKEAVDKLREGFNI